MRFFSFGRNRQVEKSVAAPSPYGNSVIVVGNGSKLMNIQKPWAHRLVLHGFTYSESRRVLDNLHTRFTFGEQLKNSSYQESMASIISDAVNNVQVGNILHESGFHRHELTINPDWQTNLSVSVERLKNFSSMGETLEIGYARKRVTIAGMFRRETHIHRVRIIEVHDKWFRAHNGEGIRNYSIANVSWVKPLGFLQLQAPYFIDIELNLEGSLVTHKLGLFKSGEEGLVEPYRLLRTKGLYIPGIRGGGGGGARIFPRFEEGESAND
jgi:hypothetical protein